MTPKKPKDTVLTCPDCGWTSQRMTAAMAARSLSQHSCEYRRMLAARAERVAAAKAKPFGPRRECRCPVANHEHGTRAMYKADDCHCRECTLANRRYINRHSRLSAYGPPALVDAEPARQHVRALMQAGMGYKRIAAAAGIHHSVLNTLLYGHRGHTGPSKKLRPKTAAAFLGVQFKLANGVPIDSTGTRRRIQALIALGWSQTRLAERSGMQLSVLWTIQRQDTVRPGTAAKIRGLYEQLWNVTPPERTTRERMAATASRNYAAKHGFAPPMAWDDDTIDNPAAHPEGVPEPARPKKGKLPTAEDLRFLLGQGESKQQLADRYGVQVIAVDQALLRAARNDEEAA